jgi:VRR-NUC domain
MTRRRQPEFKIHTAVCEHFRLRAKPGVVWLHIPNQRNGDARTGAMLKRMGVLAGAADLLIWHRGNSFALEVKSPGGRLSEGQLEFMARFTDAGGHTAVAENLDRALACLTAWGILKGRSS